MLSLMESGGVGFLCAAVADAPVDPVLCCALVGFNRFEKMVLRPTSTRRALPPWAA